MPIVYFILINIFYCITCLKLCSSTLQSSLLGCWYCKGFYLVIVAETHRCHRISLYYSQEAVKLNITFTETAQVYLAKLLDKQDVKGTVLRLFITQPGTPNAETCLAYCKPGEEKLGDIKLELDFFGCHIDTASEVFLEDAVVDFSEDKLGGELTIKAPNAKVCQVNEDSPINERIDYILQTEINPGLASHGGMVFLVEVDDGVAVLKFGGGCQGCGMVDMTLKDGVERTLLERISNLKGVRDVTDHSNRNNAYFK